MQEPIEMENLINQEKSEEVLDQKREQIKKIIIYLDISIFFLFILRLIYNLNANEFSIWIIAPIYVVIMSVCIGLLYTETYVKQTLIANAIFFSILITEEFISIYLSIIHKEFSIFVLCSLSIMLGIFGCYYSKKYFNYQN